MGTQLEDFSAGLKNFPCVPQRVLHITSTISETKPSCYRLGLVCFLQASRLCYSSEPSWLETLCSYFVCVTNLAFACFLLPPADWQSSGLPNSQDHRKMFTPIHRKYKFVMRISSTLCARITYSVTLVGDLPVWIKDVKMRCCSFYCVVMYFENVKYERYCVMLVGSIRNSVIKRLCICKNSNSLAGLLCSFVNLVVCIF